VQAIPRAVLMLFGGAATDRFRARTVMLVSDLLQSIVVLALAFLAFRGSLALGNLLIYAALSGTVFAFFLPASNTIVPDLVSGEQVQAANALGGLAFNLALFLIPPIAGLVISSVGTAPAFTINGMALLGSVATLWFVREKPRTLGDAREENQTVLRHLGQNFAAARRDAPISLTLVMAVVICLGYFGATFVGIPALAKLSLNAGNAGVGVLLGARGVGALVGGFVVGSIAIRRMGLTFCLLILGLGLAQAAGALAPTLWIAAIPFALSGAIVAAATVIFSRCSRLAHRRSIAAGSWHWRRWQYLA
jgi:MFS family permease